ncbi:MAG: FAD-dependent oxidoreductase [Armatimonadetes bacterium]|nr:FAD-dependent oxidoreductase [Armatimonadota bacterium]
MTTYDLVVVGGGAGGFGAALAGSRLGLRTLLVEKAPRLGGTAVWGGVNSWEMCAGATGVPFDLYCRMARRPHAIGVTTLGRHLTYYRADREPYRYPGAEWLIDRARTYADSLHRCGTRGMAADEAKVRAQWHGVSFEPETMAEVMAAMLAEAGCTVRLGVGFADAAHLAGHIQALGLTDGAMVTARTVVDATADDVVCRAVGCEVLIGRDDKAAWAEQGAPETATDELNGVSQLFRVTRSADDMIEPLPAGVDAKCWWRAGFPAVHVVQYPNGDLSLNMLPTMEGREWYRLGARAAAAECQRRVWAQWHWLQSSCAEFRGFLMSWIAPALGVRESYRIRAEYQLTEADLRAGLSRQQHEDIIAMADHPPDTHGVSAGGIGELREPYGVPYRCLVPRGWRNLLVASRGAGFSTIAASSCRLTRAMMQLGQAAGTAAWVAAQTNHDAAACPTAALRERLRHDGVQLEWPPSDALRARMAVPAGP